jgi:hypothetical protein
MSLLDAVIATGPVPSDDVPQAQKKRYSELLRATWRKKLLTDYEESAFQISSLQEKV